MDKEHANMLKEISVRQDISEVKDSAKKLSHKLRIQGDFEETFGGGLIVPKYFTFMDANLVDALLDYIEVLEKDMKRGT
jgi:hypothetical protein